MYSLSGEKKKKQHKNYLKRYVPVQNLTQLPLFHNPPEQFSNRRWLRKKKKKITQKITHLKVNLWSWKASQSTDYKPRGEQLCGHARPEAAGSRWEKRITAADRYLELQLTKAPVSLGWGTPLLQHQTAQRLQQVINAKSRSAYLMWDLNQNQCKLHSGVGKEEVISR